MNQLSLSGKTAVVTGGSSGLGFACAKQLADLGATVYICSTTQSELDEAVAALGGSVRAIACDITSPAALTAMYQAVEDDGRRVDVLVANAGVGHINPVEAVALDTIDLLLAVNLKGTFLTVQKALPLLNDGACVVLMSSALHLKGMAGNAIYAATKAGIRSLARTFANELSGRGIRVNSISPGPVETPIVAKQHGEGVAATAALEAALAMIPLRRIGTPKEIADAVVFLATAGTYMTGSDMVIDGGITQV